MSRYHAVITCEQDEFFIEDLNSTFGTYIDGQETKGRTQLREGARIQLGISEDKPDGEYDVKFTTRKVAGAISAATRATSLNEVGQAAFEQIGEVLVVKLTGAFRKPEIENTVQFLLLRIEGNPVHVILELSGVTYLNQQVMVPLV